MAKARRNVITAEKQDLDELTAALESQGNVIPPTIVAVMRLAAPIIARLAIRYVAKKARKRISEQAIRAASRQIGGAINTIIKNAAAENMSS